MAELTSHALSHPRTGEPLLQTQHPGYYPGYYILSQQKFWDEATRNLILMRVEQPPPIRYLTPEQAAFRRAVFDHLIPQHDRTPDRRIPLVEPLDERLYQNRTIGYRYTSMPKDREAFAMGQQAINAEAQQRFGGDFVHLPQHQQDLVLKALHDRQCDAAPEIWAKMSIVRFWQMLMQDPLEGNYTDNRVTLVDEKDRFGLPVVHVNFNLHDNDHKLIKAAKNKTMEVMHAAGATEVVQEERYAHLVGAARMGSDARSSVVDKFGRSHDIANLFICDGSILPTRGSANPGLTIQSLAARTADYLILQGESVFNSDKRDMTEPPLRAQLAPPGTYGHGIPRLK